MVFLGGSLFLALRSGAYAHVGVEQQLDTPEATDSALFERVVRLLSDETVAAGRGELLVVDARPLLNDPRIVTLSEQLTRVVPEFVSEIAHRSPLAKNDSTTRARAAILTTLGVRQSDAFRYVSCPGRLLPSTPSIVERKRQACPVEAIQHALIALPRQGGAYWPDNVDERTKFGEKSIYSVRVIVAAMSLKGRLESSTDFVFERVNQGEWVLRERRALLVVE